MDWGQLGHNWGAMYHWIELLFGDFVGKYGHTSINNASQEYTIIAHLGYWSSIAATVLVIILATSSILNIHKLAFNFKGHAAKESVVAVLVFIILIFVSPIGKNGDSLMQMMVIKIALIGDSLGNMAYSSSVDYMLTPPKLTTSPIDATTLASTILKSEVCAWSVAAHGGIKNADFKNMFSGSKIKPSMSSDSIIALQGSWSVLSFLNTINIPNVDTGSLKSIVFSPAPSVAGTGQIVGSNYCGQITFPEAKSGKDVFSKINQQQNKLMKSAVIGLVNDLNGISQAIYVVSKNGTIMTDSGSSKDHNTVVNINKSYNQAVQNYIKRVKAVPGQINTTVKSSEFVNFIKQSGWGLGVIWWKLLADTQSSFIEQAANFGSSASFNTIPVCRDDKNQGFFAFLTGSNNYCVEPAIYSTLSNNLLYIEQENNSNVLSTSGLSTLQKSNATFSKACSITGCSWGGVDSWIADSMKAAIDVGADSSKYNDSLSTHDINSLYTAKNYQSIFDVSAGVGSWLSYFSTGLWASSLGLQVSVGALEGAEKSLLGVAASAVGGGIAVGALISVIRWVANKLDIWAYAVAAPAYTLLVVLPFIPIFIWGTLLIAYLVMLVEAFIAVPLGTALWVVSDGNFISGRVMRTVMMISALLLRPFLFVVGLITSYALAPIALMIWNTLFFWGISYMSTGNFMTWYFLIWVYVGGLVKFTMLCYNASFILPDKILVWMGSGFGDVSAFGSPADFGNPQMGGSVGSGGGGGGAGGSTPMMDAGNHLAKRSDVAKDLDSQKKDVTNSSIREAREAKFGDKFLER